MRDGARLGTGKGNEDWNNTAPHGAGRKMARREASKTLSYNDFVEAMKGIYTSCVKPETLDESPAAYKNADEIIENIFDTAEVKEVIKNTNTSRKKYQDKYENIPNNDDLKEIKDNPKEALKNDSDILDKLVKYLEESYERAKTITLKNKCKKTRAVFDESSIEEEIRKDGPLLCLSEFSLEDENFTGEEPHNETD